MAVKNTHPGKSPGQGPRVASRSDATPAIEVGNRPEAPTLHPIPITDDRYAASRDGIIWTCAKRGTTQHGEWHPCNVNNNGSVSVSLASGRRVDRTVQSLLASAFPGEFGGVESASKRRRTSVVHFAVRGRPACGVTSLDAIISSRADRTTCKRCKSSDDWLEVLG